MSHRIPGFTFTGLRLYECAGISHTVAEYRHDETGIEFNLIPGGSFMMGSTAREEEQPVHRVTLDPFLMAKYECTIGQWKAMTGQFPGYRGNLNFPVSAVTWNEVQQCASRVGLELPSEAQWEYACRAGTGSTFYFGDDEVLMSRYAWYAYSSKWRKHPVGQLKPNAFGLYDMLGNVWEWCRDTFHDNYAGAPSDGRAWLGGEDDGLRIMRGGGFGSHEGLCNCSVRDADGQGEELESVGFRWSYSNV